LSDCDEKADTLINKAGKATRAPRFMLIPSITVLELLVQTIIFLLPHTTV
jgi:hypothetical protein